MAERRNRLFWPTHEWCTMDPIGYDKLLSDRFGRSFKFYVAHGKAAVRAPTSSSLPLCATPAANQSSSSESKTTVDSWAQEAELRYCADKQMRERRSLLLGECPLPRPWGFRLRLLRPERRW